MSTRTWRGSGITRKEYIVHSGTKGTVRLNTDADILKERAQIVDYMNGLKPACGEVLRKFGFPDRLGNYIRIEGHWTEISPQHNKEVLASHDQATLYGVVLGRHGVEQDSDAGFAARMLTLVGQIEDYVSRGMVHRALDCAWQLGELHTEWKFKMRHEANAVHGQRMKAGEKANLGPINALRKNRSEELQSAILQEAVEVHRKSPHLSKRAIAQTIWKRRGGTPVADTIAKWLRKKM